MDRTRLSLFYLAGYLLTGGAGFLLAPRVAAGLLQSDREYPEILLRAIGMFLIGLGIIVVQIIRLRLQSLYPTTLAVRGFFCLCLIWFYLTSHDPMFAVLLGIVLLGFILTGTIFFMEKKTRESAG